MSVGQVRDIGENYLPWTVQPEPAAEQVGPDVLLKPFALGPVGIPRPSYHAGNAVLFHKPA